MLDNSTIVNKSFTRNNFNRTITRLTGRRNMTPEPNNRLRNINKLIQTHNVSQILGDNQLAAGGGRGDVDVNIDERKEISANLTGLKKKFDETREYCNKKEKEINWMRGEIDKLKGTEQHFKDDSNKISSKTGDLESSIESYSIRLEEAAERKRSYLHMLDRMKKDKIADKIKVNGLEDLLNRESHDLSMEETQARKARQFHIQTRIVYDDVFKQAQIEERKRVQSLYAFEQNLNTKDEVERKREERIKRTQDIAENAAAEIRDSNERKWRELLMVHKFLASFLKKKMDREMKQYEAVERAFQKIKASTGLADAREIVSKFVRREDTYSELLISIAAYEKKIEELKKNNDILVTKVHLLKERNVPIEKPKTEKEHEHNQLIEVYKELHLRTETYKQAKLKIEKVRDWSLKSLMKIDKAENNMTNDHYQAFPKDKVVESFLKVIETVNQHLDAVTDEDVNKVLSEIDDVKMEEIESREYAEKNVRVDSNIANIGRHDRRRMSESRTNSRGNISANSDTQNSSREDHSIENEMDELDRHLNARRLEIKAKAHEELLRMKKIKEKEEELLRAAAK
jgi:hypothetical protein